MRHAGEGKQNIVAEANQTGASSIVTVMSAAFVGATYAATVYYFLTHLCVYCLLREY